MSYFIFGGSGFIGTHLIALIDNIYPGTKIYNLDIVKNNHEGKSTYINCDVRSEINIDISVTSEDVIFNFAAVHPQTTVLQLSIEAITRLLQHRLSYLHFHLAHNKEEFLHSTSESISVTL